jgi:hypothetical protein
VAYDGRKCITFKTFKGSKMQVALTTANNNNDLICDGSRMLRYIIM